MIASRRAIGRSRLATSSFSHNDMSSGVAGAKRTVPSSCGDTRRSTASLSMTRRTKAGVARNSRTTASGATGPAAFRIRRRVSSIQMDGSDFLTKMTRAGSSTIGRGQGRHDSVPVFRKCGKRGTTFSRKAKKGTESVLEEALSVPVALRASPQTFVSCLHEWSAMI